MSALSTTAVDSHALAPFLTPMMSMGLKNWSGEPKSCFSSKWLLGGRDNLVTAVSMRLLSSPISEELREFYSAGFSESDVIELILGISLATLCNFTSNLGRPYAWENATVNANE